MNAISHQMNYEQTVLDSKQSISYVAHHFRYPPKVMYLTGIVVSVSVKLNVILLRRSVNDKTPSKWIIKGEGYVSRMSCSFMCHLPIETEIRIHNDGRESLML